MGVTTTQTNKPFNPRGNDQSPLAFNRAKLYSGKALDFDGVNDSIDISNFSLNGYTAFSICFHKTDDFNTGMIFSSADSISVRSKHLPSIAGVFSRSFKWSERR